MQNLSLIVSFFLFLEICCHKISFWRREQVTELGFLPKENGFNLKKVNCLSFYVQNRSSQPKIDPHVNFSNFQDEDIFSFKKLLNILMTKKQKQPSSMINFAKIWSVRTSLKDIN